MLATLALIAVLVQPGNTMSGIAASHGVSLAAVEQANPQVTNPNLIYAGSTVNVPTGDDDQSAPAPAPVNDQPSAPSTGYQPSGGSSPSSASSAIPGWAQCIVQRESGGNPTSENQIINPATGGGGLFGDLTSTWGNFDGYHQAFEAPVSVQVQFNDQLSGNGSNLSPWQADGCPGT